MLGSSICRYTGTEPTALTSQPMAGWVKSGALAMNRTLRRAATTTSGGSISELVWLATSSMGPVGGTGAPATVSR